MLHSSGYLSSHYAQSLAEFGDPIPLTSSGGWLLKRPIPGSNFHDAMGLYPYLACSSWAGLANDLDALDGEGELVSIVAAPDPFGDFSEQDLQAAFPNLCRAYKQHYVADLNQPYELIVSEHHRREVDRVKRKLSVEMIDQPGQYVQLWIELFAHSVRQFNIQGLQAFSPASFEHQFSVPGTLLWLVRDQASAVVAASVTMMHGEAAYTHLLAATPAGRKSGASYAIYDANINLLKGKVRWIDWGAVPGASDAENGLKAFKSGWATGSRPAYICGRIIDRERYAQLSTTVINDAFFPCYRAQR